MTRRRSFSIILLGSLAVAVAWPCLSMAQERAARPQKRLEWPRTFGGQPDFEFERGEAIQQLQTERRQQSLPALQASTLADVLAAEGIDPFAAAVAISPTAPDTTSPTAMLNDVPLPVLPDANLPGAEQDVALNLSELEEALVQAALEAARTYDPTAAQDGTRYDFSYLKDFVQVQAIMVSPRPSAVLNGTRLAPGETLPITLTLTPPDARLLNAMQALLPTGGSPAVQQSYAQAYQNAVARLNLVRAQQPGLFTVPVQLQLKLISLAPRSVHIELNGQPYDVPLKTR